MITDRFVFDVNTTLLDRARQALAQRGDLYWVLGAAGAGKSTVCQALAERYGVTVLDMDAAIFDRFAPRYTAERHPANHTWFAPGHGLGWVLSLSWEAYAQFTRATDAEYLDLLAAELAAGDVPTGRVVVDGGLSHPSLLAQVLPVRQIVTLAVPPDISVSVWKDPNRQEMRAAIAELPGGMALWDKFLDFNVRLAEAVIAESQASGIRVVARAEGTARADAVQAVARLFGLGKQPPDHHG